jgi:hypothetical protein
VDPRGLADCGGHGDSLDVVGEVVGRARARAAERSHSGRLTHPSPCARPITHHHHARFARQRTGTAGTPSTLAAVSSLPSLIRSSCYNGLFTTLHREPEPTTTRVRVTDFVGESPSWSEASPQTHARQARDRRSDQSTPQPRGVALNVPSATGINSWSAAMAAKDGSMEIASA